MSPVEIRCPGCRVSLEQADSGLVCPDCHEAYPRSNGIIDVRQAAKGRVSSASSQRDVDARQPGDSGDWARDVRALLSASDNPNLLRSLLVSDSRTAWRIFLNPRPTDVLLDLGCEFGLRSAGIAPGVRETVAVDSSLAALQVARQRFARSNPGDAITLMAADIDGPLPFGDDAFDIVLLPERTSAVLTEVRRVLKPDGQVYFAGQNLLSYKRFFRRRSPVADRSASAFREAPLSLRGYRARLKKAGFRHVALYGLIDGLDELQRLTVTDSEVSWWRPATESDFKSTVRSSKYFVPDYGIVAGDEARGRDTLFDRVLAGISGELDVDARNLVVNRLSVSEKDKVIVAGRAGDDPIFIRIPLNASALAFEQRNYEMITRLQSAAPDVNGIPAPLAAGQVGNTPYFAERGSPGRPVREWMYTTGQRLSVDTVLQVLAGLNPAPTDRSTLADAQYESRVGVRLGELECLLSPDEYLRLQAAFRRQLWGMAIEPGIFHGDFSVSNLLIDRGGAACGLIDWEYGDADGLPVIDAVNFACSLFQAENPGVGFTECLTLLADGDPNGPAQSGILQRYCDAVEVDAGRLRGLAYFWWLSVVSCRLSAGMRYAPDEIARFIRQPLRDVILDS